MAGDSGDTPYSSMSSASSGGSLQQQVQRWVPMTVWLPAYNWRETGPKDLAGALTLGLILVAQSLAHADLCHVSVIHGPYSCMLPPFIYAMFGTCVHGSVGTGGLVALLTGVQLQRFDTIEMRTHASGIFTLEVGAVLVLMGALRLAFLVRFLSRPALSGFITASALLIMQSQVVPALGLPGTVKTTLGVLEAWDQANPGTASVSAATVILLTQAKHLGKIHRYLKPLAQFKELLALALGVVFCSYHAANLGIEIVGQVPSGFPGMALPLASAADWELAREMLPGACLVGLVTFLSSFAGAKKFAMLDGYAVDATSELLSLGLANLSGCLCDGVPVQVGLSRLGIARAAGVQTQLGANMLVAVIVAVTVKLCSTELFFIPRCVLSCIILVGASHLTEFAEAEVLYRLYDSWSQRKDLAVWLVAFGSTVLIGAFEGIIVAVVVSLVLVLYQVAQPPIRTLGEVPGHERWLDPRQDMRVQQRPGVLVFRVEGPIFYANAETLQDRIEALEMEEASKHNYIRCIVLSASAVSFVDSTGVQVLTSLLKVHRDRDVAFFIANAFGRAQVLFERSFRPLGLLRQDTLDLTVHDCLEIFDRAQHGLAKRPTFVVSAAELQSRPAEFFKDSVPELVAEERHFTGSVRGSQSCAPSELRSPGDREGLRRTQTCPSRAPGNGLNGAHLPHAMQA